MSTVAQYRAILDRLPDEIALAIGLHVYDGTTLADGRTCVCGAIVREALARVRLVGVEDVDAESDDDISASGAKCGMLFGTTHEWLEIYRGVTIPSEVPLIEEALFGRVMAAVERSEP